MICILINNDNFFIKNFSFFKSTYPFWSNYYFSLHLFIVEFQFKLIVSKKSTFVNNEALSANVPFLTYLLYFELYSDYINLYFTIRLQVPPTEFSFQ